jgi:hypothetical protein
MAEDLISPEHGESQGGETKTEEAAAAPRKRVALESESPKRFRGRFWFVYVILALGVAGAIAGAVIIATDNSSSSKHPSAQGGLPATFTPTHGSDQSVTHQIASQVTSEYSKVNDFVHVVSQEPLQLHPPLAAVETRWDFGVLSQPRKTNVDLTDNSWLYEICGAASSCGLANTGQESGVKFERRLFRGMLELTLYTFKSIPRIQSVIVLLPPTGQQNSNSYALYVKRASVGALLRLPVSKAVGKAGAPLGNLGSRINSHLYQWNPSQVEQLPDMSLVLPLNKPEQNAGFFGG